MYSSRINVIGYKQESFYNLYISYLHSALQHILKHEPPI
jgi:hypothetical protein